MKIVIQNYRPRSDCAFVVANRIVVFSEKFGETSYFRILLLQLRPEFEGNRFFPFHLKSLLQCLRERRRFRELPYLNFPELEPVTHWATFLSQRTFQLRHRDFPRLLTRHLYDSFPEAYAIVRADIIQATSQFV